MKRERSMIKTIINWFLPLKHSYVKVGELNYAFKYTIDYETGEKKIIKKDTTDVYKCECCNKQWAAPAEGVHIELSKCPKGKKRITFKELMSGCINCKKEPHLRICKKENK